jgi:hypothetical protein
MDLDLWHELTEEGQRFADADDSRIRSIEDGIQTREILLDERDQDSFDQIVLGREDRVQGLLADSSLRRDGLGRDRT